MLGTAYGQSQGDSDERKRAAEIAVGEVKAGMKLGLGTGRTADHFVRLLGARVRGGLDVVGVPTSERIAKLARAEGIKLTSLDAEPVLDLAVDGADEIDPQLRLIKGGGGALLREKIVAAAARKMIVVADASKLVATLGAFPLPIEITPFGGGAVRASVWRAAAALGLSGPITLRMSVGGPFVTDSGNHILDASFGRIPEAEALAEALDRIPGVVEHGLFIGLATTAIVARGDCVEWLIP
jgi:ribose 5-phosphate isomerase A